MTEHDMPLRVQDYVDRLEKENVALKAENKQLQDELVDWRESQRSIMAERCGDEVHCTCVPGLRREIKQLQDKIEGLELAYKLELLERKHLERRLGAIALRSIQDEP